MWLVCALALTATLRWRSSPPGTDISNTVSIESRQLALEWLPLTEGRQYDALADGEVSQDEYIAALEAGLECMRAAGFRTSEVRLTPDGIRRDFTVTQTTQSDDAVSRAWEDCRRRCYGPIEAVWLLQHKRQDVPDEQLVREMRDCIEATGITLILPESVPYYEVPRELTRLKRAGPEWACFDRYMIYAGRSVVRPR